MNMFDKRIELLEGLALAVKLKDKTVSKEAAYKQIVRLTFS